MREAYRADGEPDGDAERSERADGESRLESVEDSRHESDFAQREAKHLHLPELCKKPKAGQHEAHECHYWRGDFQELDHFDLLQDTVLCGTITAKIISFCDSDNVSSVAYYLLEVKPKQKPAFLLFLWPRF